MSNIIFVLPPLISLPNSPVLSSLSAIRDTYLFIIPRIPVVDEINASLPRTAPDLVSYSSSTTLLTADLSNPSILLQNISSYTVSSFPSSI
jgi:hypothetical protein